MLLLTVENTNKQIMFNDPYSFALYSQRLLNHMTWSQITFYTFFVLTHHYFALSPLSLYYPCTSAVSLIELICFLFGNISEKDNNVNHPISRQGWKRRSSQIIIGCPNDSDCALMRKISILLDGGTGKTIPDFTKTSSMNLFSVEVGVSWVDQIPPWEHLSLRRSSFYFLFCQILLPLHYYY